MVPIPTEADEEARRAHREREDLAGERRSIVNKIGGILATLGVKGFKALRRDRRKQLDLLRQPDGDPIPPLARARIERLLDRLELVLKLIEEVETARDAVLDKASPANEAERMIRPHTRFSDACMTEPSTRANSRRPKSAGARNRGVQGSTGAAT